MAGAWPDYSADSCRNHIVISESMASSLGLAVGDKGLLHIRCQRHRKGPPPHRSRALPQRLRRLRPHCCIHLSGPLAQCGFLISRPGRQNRNPRTCRQSFRLRSGIADHPACSRLDRTTRRLLSRELHRTDRRHLLQLAGTSGHQCDCHFHTHDCRCIVHSGIEHVHTHSGTGAHYRHSPGAWRPAVHWCAIFSCT